MGVEKKLELFVTYHIVHPCSSENAGSIARV